MSAEARFFLLVDLREFFSDIGSGGGGGKAFLFLSFFQSYFSLISPEKY